MDIGGSPVCWRNKLSSVVLMLSLSFLTLYFTCFSPKILCPLRARPRNFVLSRPKDITKVIQSINSPCLRVGLDVLCIKRWQLISCLLNVGWPYKLASNESKAAEGLLPDFQDYVRRGYLPSMWLTLGTQPPLGYWLLELSHHAVRMPWSYMERLCISVLTTTTAEDPADSMKCQM